jgi:hypothetical protein
MRNKFLCLIVVFAFIVACKEKPVKIDDAVKKRFLKQ